MLALAGVGAGLFLFVLMPRLSTTRAASKRVELVPQVEAPASAVSTAPAPTELLSLTPNENSEAVSMVEAGTPESSGLLARKATVDPDAPRFEAPLLKPLKGGKHEVVKPSELRADRREKRKERLAAATEQARVTGEVPEAPIERASVSNPNLKIEKKGQGKAGDAPRKSKKKNGSPPKDE